MTVQKIEAGFYARACRDRTHRPQWVVTMRKHNRSTFHGGRLTSSLWSEVRCLACNAIWRTKAAYVDTLPDK